MPRNRRAASRGPNDNLAARTGRWSARHRKAAIFGWLAFVVVALVLGGVVGTKELGDADAVAGEAGRAARTYAAAGFDRGSPESVLVRGETLRESHPEFTAAVRDVEQALRRLGDVGELRSPYSHRDQISEDGHSALIEFRIGARDGPGRTFRPSSAP
jgi:uncharacterized membrane protein YdfJ with MMPL/SSD domain